MLSLSDTLQELLSRYASMMWSIFLESEVLGVPVID